MRLRHKLRRVRAARRSVPGFVHPWFGGEGEGSEGICLHFRIAVCSRKWDDIPLVVGGGDVCAVRITRSVGSTRMEWGYHNIALVVTTSSWRPLQYLFTTFQYHLLELWTMMTLALKSKIASPFRNTKKQNQRKPSPLPSLSQQSPSRFSLPYNSWTPSYARMDACPFRLVQRRLWP